MARAEGETAKEHDRSGVTPDVIAAALEKVTTDSSFAASNRLVSLLRFLVEETLAGREAQLKAYTIATSVLGLPATFDPQTNSIVRVEAMRLRKALDRYYAGSGAADPIKFILQPGSYVPRFSSEVPDRPAAVSRSPEPAVDVAPAAEAGVADQPPVAPSRRRAILAAVLATSVALGALSVAWFVWSGADTSVRVRGQVGAAIPGQARIRVEFPGRGVGAGANSLEERLRLNIEAALTRFENPVVQEVRRPVASSADGPHDYLLSGRLAATADTWSASFRIVRAATGDVLWARTFEKLTEADLVSPGSPLVWRLVNAIARRYGVIPTDLRLLLSRSPDPLEGYGCIFAAHSYFALPSLDGFRTVEDCLKRTIDAYPGFPQARASYARLLVDGWYRGQYDDPGARQEVLGQAARLADEAVSLRPYSSRAHMARFAVRMADHRFDDAFEEGRIAMELNPLATDAAANVGAAYVSRGRFAEGIALLQKSSQFRESAPVWYDIYFFLDAYMRRDWTEAARRSRRRSLDRFPAGFLAKILVAVKNNDTDETGRLTDAFLAAFPSYASRLPDSLERQGFAVEIRERILADLRGTRLLSRLK